MKRAIWLLLAVFCTALAQVQAVDVGVARAKTCPCCCHQGGCGMPGCPCPTVPSAPELSLSQAEEVATAPAARCQEASGEARAHRSTLFAEATAVGGALPSAVKATPAAILPLFKAHCSLLI